MVLHNKSPLPIESGRIGLVSSIDKSRLERSFLILNRHEFLALFCRQLAMLFNSGLQLAPSLETLATQMEGLKSEVFTSLSMELHAGRTLSQAVQSQSDLFSEAFVALLRCGEQSGTLHRILDQAADQFERQTELQKKLRAAAIYPIFLMTLSTVFLGVLVTIFVPRMLELTDGLNAEMGPLLSALHTILRLAVDPFVVFSVLQFVVLTVILLYLWRRSVSGRRISDELLLHLPLVGETIRLAASVNWSRNLSLLLTSGVPLTKALGSLQETLNNKVLQNEQRLIIQAIAQEGLTLAEATERFASLDFTLLHFLVAGEESGKVVPLLELYANIGQENLQNRLDVLSSLVEPLILMVLGGVVTAVTLLFFLPMAQVLGSLG